MESKTQKVYTVSLINQYIKNLFLSDYALTHISIKGEVSNLKYHSSGHIYFTLKDAKSQIPCVMFAGQRSGLSFRMTAGDNVIVIGNISVYERDGRYQLYASHITKNGQGLLYEQFELLKKELLENGIFDSIHKKEIPYYAKKIGIVTADTGAAIQDIIHISKRRNPYVQLILYPAKVQGTGAAQTIISGIKKLDDFGVDVIIVGRGGGSIEDLWAFNEKKVAMAIYHCKTPVISAVGHETDTTIADYVSDLRAPTPSAAAELAVLNISELKYNIVTREEQFHRLLSGKIKNSKFQVQQIKLRLEQENPVYKIQQNRQRAADLENALQRNVFHILNRKKHTFQLYVEKLKAMSPLAKLDSGFLFVTDENEKPIKRISDVKKDSIVKISTFDGTIYASIKSTEKGRIF